MKKLIKDYLKIIAISITGLVFCIAVFYIILNYYHNEELKRRVYVANNNYYDSYMEKLNKVENNLNKFQSQSNKKISYVVVYNNLNTCYKIMKNENIVNNLKSNYYYSAYDIYNFGGDLQSDFLNKCWALHLSNIKNNQDFKDIAPYVEKNVKLIASQTENAISEIQNNSSYFFNTNITSLTVRNFLESDYKAIMNSYDEFADVILLLSETINDGGR